MSGKIKSKDLSYDSTLPPFLQRLKEQNAGRGDPDRHERAVARPRRAKDPNEDDGPTVVDESGETVSKEEYEKLTKTDEDDAARMATGADAVAGVKGEVDAGAEPTPPIALPRKEDKITDGLGSKKRKAAKIISEDDDGDYEQPSGPVREDAKKAAGGEKKAAAGKPKKKAKPIKLAFNDDEEG